MYDRREFLFRSAALGAVPLVATLGVDAAGAAQPPLAPQVRRKVPLGRTGLLIPDIGFGASRLSGDVALVQHALARGITYYDTAESYAGSESESTLGRALAGRRDEVVLATKTHGGAHTSRAELMASLDASLARLRTDRVEVFFNHAVNGTDRLRNEEWFEFASRAKQAGKIRFTGISGHGGNLVECLDLAVAEKLVDVLLVAFNFGQDPAFYERFTGSFDFIATQPELPRVLKKAKASGIGVVAMKTLRGARLNDMRPYERGGATFAQAAFRWVLASGLADALVVTMSSTAQLDEFLGASGFTALHAEDAALLRRYAKRSETTQCRYGCSDCASACPLGVSIPDALRLRMYAEDYGAPELASEARAEAGNLGACLGCDGTPCASACPHGVAIDVLVQRAARIS
ncbi:MAG: aldo/keto reductase [Deltaproteobacteria bacterium]|nr:aldo/keto reductase [Deltaproteobacteria bacterium]